MQKTFATFLWVNIRQSALSLVQLMVVEMHPHILDSVGMIRVVVIVVEVRVVVRASGLLTHHTMHGLLNLDQIVSHTISKTSGKTWLRISN